MPIDSWSTSSDIFALSNNGEFIEDSAPLENFDVGFPDSLNKFGEFIEVVSSTVVPVCPSSLNALYRFRGYYVLGSAYEFWTGAAVNTPNPSGNPLINVVIDCILDA